ncbi:g2758 [Coccomyxa elongata]
MKGGGQKSLHSSGELRDSERPAGSSQDAEGTTQPTSGGRQKGLRLASTLDGFFIRIHCTSKAVEDVPSSSNAEQQEPLVPPRTDTVCTIRNLRERDLQGRCRAFGKAALQHIANSKYQEVASVDLGAPSHVTALQLDSNGTMLAVALETGTLAIWKFDSIRSAGNHDRVAGEPEAAIEFTSGRSKRTRLAWNPLKHNCLYALSPSGYYVAGFDLAHNLEELSATRYGNFEQMAGRGGNAMPRYLDLDFFKSQGPHLMATAGSDGAVALWDARVAKRPCSVLQGPQHTGALQTVQVAPDGRAVIAGSDCGQVLMWDVRGGRAPTAQLGAYGPARHPLLSAVRLRAALAAVPGLTQQTPLPGTSLLSLILDPLDPRRAAFCLPSGWQGVLDLVSQEVTHLYCPPNSEEEMFSQNYDVIEQQPAWGANGGPYCSASSFRVALLDFNSGTSSPCSVSGSESEGVPRLPSSVHVPTSAWPRALAVHPHTQEIVAAVAGDCSLLLLNRAGTDSPHGGQPEPG